jgi:hypothetical protein
VIQQAADPYLPGASVDQAPPSPAKPPQAPSPRVPPATPPVIIDLAKEAREWGPKPHNWDSVEKKAVDAYIKSTYGLNETTGDNTGGWPCYHDLTGLLFPGYFYACKRNNPPCKFHHALTATEAEGPYLDGSESQKDAIRALTPSWTAAIADSTLNKSKVSKKAPGT